MSIQTAIISSKINGGDQVIYPSVDAAVSAAVQAQIVFQDHSLKVRRAVIEAIRTAAISTRSAGADGGRGNKMGRVEDKVQKNLLCAARTPGVEDLQSRAYSGDKGLTLVEYSPFGVVAAITPSNNPAATVISNAIAILAAGNAVVFAPHPSAINVCHDVIRTLASAAVSAGAPMGLITTTFPATHESTRNSWFTRGPPQHGNRGPAVVKWP